MVDARIHRDDRVENARLRIAIETEKNLAERHANLRAKASRAVLGPEFTSPLGGEDAPARRIRRCLLRGLEPAERMCRLVLLRDDLIDAWLAAHRVLERFLCGLVVVVVNLLVVGRFPMDEHAAHAHE